MAEPERIIQSQLLQLGISLAVAQGVIHYSADSGRYGTPMWCVEDIVKELDKNRGIYIYDPKNLLRLKTGMLQRVGYVQAVIFLASQTVDIMRQVRAE